MCSMPRVRRARQCRRDLQVAPRRRMRAAQFPTRVPVAPDRPTHSRAWSISTPRRPLRARAAATELPQPESRLDLDLSDPVRREDRLDEIWHFETGLDLGVERGFRGA